MPTGSITDLASTDEIRLLDLSDALPRLQERYGEAYQPAEVEEGDYEGTAAARTIGVPNLLMVDASMPDALAYEITELLFARKKQLSEVTPQAESLDPKESRTLVEPLRLHPGAERFYEAAGR